MTLGDKSTLFSPGRVTIDTEFLGELGQRTTTIVRVVRNFPFNVLLGRPFLAATLTLTRFFHRFKTWQFPRLIPKMAFNFIDTFDAYGPDLLSV